MQVRPIVKIPRQLLIALDAMEWSLVEKWANEGKLPAFRRLMEQGARAELSTTAAQLPDTVWACIYTGTNPAKFEKFFYVQYDATKMGLRNVPDDAISRAPFWDYLSAAGQRVGIADVPKFPLSQSINGFQFTNWGAHATKTARTSYPPNLIQEIDAQFGRHPVGDCDKFDAKPESLRELRQRVLAGTRLHGQVFRKLMREQSWNLFFAGFSAPHCIGHHFWPGLAAPQTRDAEVDIDFAGAMEEVYCAIDKEIGEMLSLVESTTRVLVVAGHGMGPMFHASWNLPEMLDRWGYGTNPPSRVSSDEEPHSAKVNPWRILKMVVPGPIQYAIKNMLPQFAQDQLLFLWYRGGKKWKGCRAFAIPNNDSVGAIRISLKGRDRDGLVAPGKEYEQVCREIADALYELTDKEGGRPIVKRVTLTHETFHGPFLDQLPDLTVLWDQSFVWNTVYSPRFGTLQIKQQDSRKGGHSSHGFVLVTGPDVPAGVQLPCSSIYDIAPTVLKAANLPIPEIMDGRPLPIPSLATTTA